MFNDVLKRFFRFPEEILIGISNELILRFPAYLLEVKIHEDTFMTHTLTTMSISIKLFANSFNKYPAQIVTDYHFIQFSFTV